MHSRVVSETWRAETRHLETSDFFAELPACPFAFLYGSGRWLILAEDPLVCLDSACPDRLLFERRGPLPPIQPDLIGHVNYEYGYRLDPTLPPAPGSLDPLPDFQLVLYRRVRLYDRVEGRLYLGERETERTTEVCLHTLGKGAFAARKIGDSDHRQGYEAKVECIREEIARGNVYQVNLTRQERWSWEGDLSCFAKRLCDLNPAPFSALVAGPGWSLVSSSPESFLRIKAGRLSTRPIKGTAPRGRTEDEDRGLGSQLLASAKNRSELAMIVDLLRNDLNRVCQVPSVRVDAFPVLESYANVHHLVAEVSGALRPEVTLEALLRATFPGGSITGCPKLAAMALIRELEPEPRRIYTGALGWCRSDLRQAEFAIAIRTAWAWDGELRFGVGGGIVWDSDPHEEYEETLHKGRSLVRCLS